MTRILAALVIVAAAIVAVVLVWPQLFGLALTPGVAQVVAMRGPAVAVGVIVALALTLLALLVGSVRRFAASLAVIALGFSAVNAIVLATRGADTTGFETATASDVRVLTWNTLGDEPGAAVIADLVFETEATIVALPETTWETGMEVAALLAEQGIEMAVFTVPYDQISKARSTTLLIGAELGAYTVDVSERTTAQLPSVVATPLDHDGPTIIAVHAVAPLPPMEGVWRADLRWLANACAGDDVIMAGDFNGTVDHFAGLGDQGRLGNCADAAQAADAAAFGTWPTSLPALLGSPIDHVMATDTWRVTGVRVIQSHDGYGSDHRPLLAQLTPAG